MRKQLLLLTATAAMAACLTGCGSDGPEQKIVFWHCLGHAKTIELNKVAKRFNEKYVGQYKMDLVHLAGDYDGLHDSLKTKLSSGEVPALSMGYPDSFAEYIGKVEDESAILKLDTFINDPEIGYTETEINDFVKGYWDEGKGYHFDGVWSVPMYKSTEVMYYNRSYMDGLNEQNKAKFASDAQFKTLSEKVSGKTRESSATFTADLAALKEYVVANGGYTYNIPTKWDDMITLARQIMADRTAQNVKGEFYPLGYDSDANMIISQFAQRGIDYTVNDAESKADPEKHFKFNTAEAKTFVQDILNLVNDKVMVTKGSLGGNKYTNDYFGEGKLVMTIGSTGGSSYNISSNFQVDLAAVPYYGETPKYIQQGPSICLFNNDDENIHKGAWLFYKELAEVESNAALALENSYDPIRTSSYDTDNYKTWIAQAGKGLKYDIPAMTATLKNYYFTSPTFIGSGTARNEIGQIINNVKNKGVSLDDAFNAAFTKCKNAAKAAR